MKILLIVYDNDSYISWFPHGLAYISSYLKKDGHDVEVYSQDVYHWPESHLEDFLNKNYFDIVCVGVIGGYYQYNKLIKISAAINNSKKRPIFIIGGHGPSPEPKYFLEKTKSDFIVIGEGEITICELLKNLNNPSIVNGIAYMDNGNLVKTSPRELIKNIDEILFPDWNSFEINHYALGREPGFSKSDRLMPVLSGRGCPYKCNFCYRMLKGFRARSPDGIIDEILKLKRDFYINAIDFSDELLMSNKNRTKLICEAFLKKKLNIKWSCNGRLNFADKETLQMMKDSGCVFINYGIECMDDNILKIMNKNLTIDTIIKGVENTNEIGIIQGLNIIFGNIKENKNTLIKGVEFLKKYNLGGQMRTIRPVTPYPGSPLYYYAIENGLLEGPEDFYEHKHLNSDLLSVNFTELTDNEFYEVLKEANSELIKDYYSKNEVLWLEQIEKLYCERDASFRGFRQI